MGDPGPSDDRRTQREAAWEITIRAVVVGVPMLVVALLLRGLGLPWWLIGLSYAIFLWIVITEG